MSPNLKSPPTPSHPSGSSQCTSPEHPVSCIKFGLVIYFTCGYIHVSMLFSQVIPPSPSSTESKSLFFVSVSLSLCHVQDHHCHLSKFHTYALIYCMGVFSFWLTSLSSFIHPIRTDINAFFLIAEQYSIAYMYHSFLIHSSADGQLGCFHCWTYTPRKPELKETHVPQCLSQRCLSYDVCFSLSDLLHSVQQSLDPCMLLQIVWFHYFLWLSNILLNICTTYFFSYSSGS